MKSILFSNVTFLLLAALAGGSLVASPTAAVPSESVRVAEDWSYSAEASKLLNDIRSAAARLNIQTDALDSYTRGGLSWESHASRLNKVRDDINEMGRLLRQFDEMRAGTAPWQRQAVDSIAPVAANLATRTEAAIGHLNENRQYLWAPVYIDHLKAMAEHASQVKKTVDVHLELADTMQNLDDLRIKAVNLNSSTI